MVGGVLVERKVGEVEPALIGNRDKVIWVRFWLHSRYECSEFIDVHISTILIASFFQMAKLIETLEKQLSDKGQDINDYMEKHNIQVRGAGNQKKELEQSSKEANTSDSKNTGVLVNTK